MTVIVCGGRKYTDVAHVFKTLDSLNVTKLIHGGAEGADAIAQQWADSRKVEWVVYHAEWKKFGRAAGPVRNQRMLDEGQPDLVVAFPGGRGTLDMIRRATKSEVKVLMA